MYEWADPVKSCYYRNSGRLTDIIWQWATLSIWIELSVVYCMGVLIAVAIKLRKSKANVSSKSTSIDSIPLTTPSLKEFKNNRPKAENLISLMARKMTLYPAVPLITQTPKLLVQTLAFSQQRMCYVLLFISFIGCAIQGLLNAIVFARDASLSRGRFALRKYLWEEYVDVYESRYPHRARRNKNSEIEIELSTMTTVQSNPPNIYIEQHEDQNDVHPKMTKLRQSMWEPTLCERIKYKITIKCVGAPEKEASASHNNENSTINAQLPQQTNATHEFFNIPDINKTLAMSLPRVPPTIALPSSRISGELYFRNNWSHNNDLELNNDESEENEPDSCPVSSSALIFPDTFDTNNRNTYNDGHYAYNVWLDVRLLKSRDTSPRAKILYEI
ncbi:1959_t:CDS:2 [Ambispora gerdemannii]|uniref:1959_t:CDS:1 n=1 Tax=Ambispora gerdemannii TaxID=144530 RepID=A0A9N9B628_9GLOM|nr:1959_t:CDS:2 [Ambispora gerdemannii]